MINLPVEARLTEYLHNKAALAGVPLNGTFELTPCCNMSCKMCYVRLTGPQQQALGPLKTADQWLELAEQLRREGMLFLLLTGGEPFVHPQFREILEGLHKMGLIVSVNTNGTLITPETVRWLRECPPSRFNITLYGASDETYGRLCNNPHGFTQVTEAIRLLTEAGMTVKLNCSVTPYNCGDLEGIFDYADRNDLRIQATSYMFPPVRRDEHMIGQNDRFSPEEAAYQAAKIQALLNGRERFLRDMAEHAPMQIPGDVGEDCPELPDQGDGIQCRAGKCSFWVTWQGQLMPCGMFPTKDAPNVFDRGFLPCWEQVRRTVREIRLPRACAACPVKDECRACAAMVYTETGSFDRVPKYRCQMEQAFLPACRRLERELQQKEREE